MTRLTTWLRTHRVGIRLYPWPASTHTWTEALEDVRYALAAGVLYLVGTALVCLLLSVGELGETAARGPELVERIPYWQEGNR